MVIKMHYSVLKEELLEGLNIQDGKIYVDATIGYAGDSKEILKQIPNGFLYGFDQDKKAVEYSTSALTKIGNNFKIFNTNFVNMDETVEKIGIKEVDGMVISIF